MAMLDTTVLIDLSRGQTRPNAVRLAGLLNALTADGELFYTSRVNEAEFRVGGYRTKNSQHTLDAIGRVLEDLPILEFDTLSADCYARIKARLLDLGRPSGDADTMIAAVALANGQRLVTRNPKHFADVPGLQVDVY